MKLYTCAKCSNLLYFENTLCLNCDAVVGFDAGSLSMLALQPGAGNVFTDIKNEKNAWRFCANAEYKACNWIVPADSPVQFCVACNLNRTIPFTGKPENLAEWKRIEAAKHRLIYSLFRLHLPIEKKQGAAEAGLIFEFLEDNNPARKVITQHDDGRIELNINEADEAQRVRNKLDLGEKYRTLLGHFRHEIGHYYWDVFYRHDEGAAEQFRTIFGDERTDYDTALKQYYANGIPADWNNSFISQYATSHPWEDWAETWAHYLHISDALDTACNWSVRLGEPANSVTPKSVANDDSAQSFKDRISHEWLPLSQYLNAACRSLGEPDAYPYVLSPAVIDKLAFVQHAIVAWNSSYADID